MIGRKVILTSRDVRMQKIYAYFEFWHPTQFGIYLGVLKTDNEIQIYNLDDWNVIFESW